MKNISVLLILTAYCAGQVSQADSSSAMRAALDISAAFDRKPAPEKKKWSLIPSYEELQTRLGKGGRVAVYGAATTGIAVSYVVLNKMTPPAPRSGDVLMGQQLFGGLARWLRISMGSMVVGAAAGILTYHLLPKKSAGQ